jgi:hypothetical protein
MELIMKIAQNFIMFLIILIIIFGGIADYFNTKKAWGMLFAFALTIFPARVLISNFK